MCVWPNIATIAVNLGRRQRARHQRQLLASRTQYDKHTQPCTTSRAGGQAVRRRFAVSSSHTHSQCKVMTGTAGGRARASSSRWPSCRGGAHAICGRLPAGKTGGEYRCCQAPRSTSLRLYHRAVCITAPWRSPGSRNFCKNIYLRQRLRRNTCDPHRPARLHVLPGNSTLCTGPPVCP